MRPLVRKLYGFGTGNEFLPEVSPPNSCALPTVGRIVEGVVLRLRQRSTGQRFNSEGKRRSTGGLGDHGDAFYENMVPTVSAKAPTCRFGSGQARSAFSLQGGLITLGEVDMQYNSPRHPITRTCPFRPPFPVVAQQSTRTGGLTVDRP